MTIDTYLIQAAHEARRPAPGAATFRQDTKWDLMSNEDLKFALDLLFRHGSTSYLADALEEVDRRIDRGTWIDIDDVIINVDDLPGWLRVWPFCLLSRQQRQKRSRR